MTGKAELEPCPFCGEVTDTVATIDGAPVELHAVICRACGAMCPRQTEAEAITAWNTRIASTEALTAENAKLREALTAIRQRPVERALKWMGMMPSDIARQALAGDGQPKEQDDG